MTDKQIDTFIGLITGVRFAVLHLANVVAARTNLSSSDLAKSFLSTAENVPLDAKNRELIQLILRQVSEGIQLSSSEEQHVQEINKVLH